MVVRNVDTTIGTNKKFIAKYKGSYVIKKVLPNDRYVVTDIENCPVTQMPYEGILEASRSGQIGESMIQNRNCIYYLIFILLKHSIYHVKKMLYIVQP